MKKKWTIAAVLVLVVALLAVGTWAYFSAVGRADNVITMGSVKLALHDEDGAGQPFTTVSAMPGSVVNKVVYVENVGSGAFYTRVKITPEVVDANGKLVPLTDRSLLTLDLNDPDWIPGTDGYYYYRGSVDPKTATSKLFNHVTFSKDMGNEYQNATVHIYVTRACRRRTSKSTLPMMSEMCGSTSVRSKRAPRARRSTRSRRPEKGGRLYEKTYSLARPLRSHAPEHVPVHGRGRHGGH